MWPLPLDHLGPPPPDPGREERWRKTTLKKLEVRISSRAPRGRGGGLLRRAAARPSSLRASSQTVFHSLLQGAEWKYYLAKKVSKIFPDVIPPEVADSITVVEDASTRHALVVQIRAGEA